ncbi:hypothetical protein GcC1_223001 [Golovinomyces cichoracearum]|uniref:Uncharacterized protein n=1 Tax=Golovinomyces cichoracearum TaxID=62708 RepID=A0A420H6Z4_9PEZI|nr:hypothetical protein GcC1_223001 [Golovinomyces cichoracearum]
MFQAYSVRDVDEAANNISIVDQLSPFLLSYQKLTEICISPFLSSVVICQLVRSMIAHRLAQISGGADF